MSARRIPYPLLIALTLAALLAAAAFSLFWGRYPIPLNAVWQTLAGQNPDETYANIIFNLRLPRIAAAMLVGAALSLAGAVYQGIFRNPLVSPDLLGVSSGACVGAAAAVLAAWRDLLYTKRSSLMALPALSVAAFIATILAACSEAMLSLNA